MTRLPADSRDVQGIDYDQTHPKYKVGPLCSRPACSRLADHAHHIWRRSFLAGDYGWVRLWDGREVQNLTGLCHVCHQLVTENEARIVFWGDTFWWEDSAAKTALEPQPRAYGQKVVRTVIGVPPEVVGPGAVEKCPTCQRSISRGKAPREAARHRQKWTVTVPVDERENGADVLDTLVEECAKLFGHDETAQVRYFTVAQALALVVQHGHQLVADSGNT